MRPCARDEAVDVVDETRVARLGPRDGEVGGRAPVDAPQLAHLVASEAAQGRAFEQREQVFEALPGVSALAYETFGRGVGHRFGRARPAARSINYARVVGQFMYVPTGARRAGFKRGSWAGGSPF